MRILKFYFINVFAYLLCMQSYALETSNFISDNPASNFQEYGSIKGRVINSRGEIIPFATVSIIGGEKTESDKNGVFLFENLTEGTYRIQSNYFNLFSGIKEAILKKGERLNVDIIIEKNSIELEEVLVVGSKYSELSKKKSEYVARMPLDYMENPQVYNVVNKELLKVQMAMTLEEAFINIPGATPAKTGAGMPGFFSRGFQTSYSFRDGMSTAQNTTVDLSIVDRVETIKGPTGTLFGAILPSYGGTINYIVKKPYETFGGEISYLTGSWDLNRVTADINAPLTSDKSVLFRNNFAFQSENFFQDQGIEKTFVFSPGITYKVSDRLSVDFLTDFTSTSGSSFTAWRTDKKLNIKNLKDLNVDYKKSFINNSLIGDRSSKNISLTAQYKMSKKWRSETKYIWSNASYNDLIMSRNIWMSKNTIKRQVLVYKPNKEGRIQFQQNFVGNFKLGGA